MLRHAARRVVGGPFHQNNEALPLLCFRRVFHSFFSLFSIIFPPLIFSPPFFFFSSIHIVYFFFCFSSFFLFSTFPPSIFFCFFVLFYFIYCSFLPLVQYKVVFSLLGRTTRPSLLYFPHVFHSFFFFSSSSHLFSSFFSFVLPYIFSSVFFCSFSFPLFPPLFSSAFLFYLFYFNFCFFLPLVRYNVVFSLLTCLGRSISYPLSSKNLTLMAQALELELETMWRQAGING